jgi:hypothetical protein
MGNCGAEQIAARFFRTSLLGGGNQALCVGLTIVYLLLYTYAN